ncbi:hypothetical protein SARC_10217 [Sphaeroforma arctica JP610]|uniref:Uncharacterized protein n=1 Tax=Sphaeroforma arctica JP610 TaxID=667725 RepID=A0A0L0FMR0_9EUKA|nr:hypothetical protein SARC_10217 [Sphaeroforma arctica JP610]KNC77323.1 hypothetical protein SARC_10217 [Sphaeroforma arctica JP610]|eukprot:XP_014151225.1 hypothetical protein SARC_10217 [Sphaeroforma arctica JP610]
MFTNNTFCENLLDSILICIPHTSSYTPRNYNGVVMVVRAIENEDNYNYMTDWSLHCPKTVYHDNPGTYFTCLKGDNGAKMASLLSVALEVATYKLTNIPREGGDDPIVGLWRV